MFLTCVIDKQTHTIREVLARLLKEHRGCCLDIVTACFNTGGQEKKDIKKQDLTPRREFRPFCSGAGSRSSYSGPWASILPNL